MFWFDLEIACSKDDGPQVTSPISLALNTNYSAMPPKLLSLSLASSLSFKFKYPTSNLLMLFRFFIGTIFKVFSESVTMLLLSHVSGFRHVGPLVSDQATNPHPTHWKKMSQPLDHQGSSPASNVTSPLGCLLTS